MGSMGYGLEGRISEKDVFAAAGWVGCGLERSCAQCDSSRRWVAVRWFSGSGKRKWAISLRDMISLHEIELGEELGWPRSRATPYALLEALFPTISPVSAPYLPAVTLPRCSHSKNLSRTPYLYSQSTCSRYLHTTTLRSCGIYDECSLAS